MHLFGSPFQTWHRLLTKTAVLLTMTKKTMMMQTQFPTSLVGLCTLVCVAETRIGVCGQTTMAAAVVVAVLLLPQPRL